MVDKLQPDPYDESYADEGSTGEACSPSGAAIVETKDDLYVVQPEDLSALWKVPTKYSLPVQTQGGGWRWHELRNANLDWPGGFVTQNGACVFQGLYAGATLKVPKAWPPPKPGVQTKRKKGKTSKGAAIGGLVAVGIGIAVVTGLAVVAARAKKGQQ